MAWHLERLVAKRMAKGKSALSRPIVNIAIASIALGVAVMILALFIVQGFQDQIQKKVIDFGGHMQITANSGLNKETEAIPIDYELIDSLKAIQGVKGVELFAAKPVILETKEAIQALVVKGIDTRNNTDFLEKKMLRGKPTNAEKNTVALSAYTANKMQVDTASRVTLYFVLGRDDIKPRKFTVSGIYETGLEEFDKQFAFLDISHLQKINNWGLEAQWRLADSCRSHRTWIEPLAFGGDGNHRFAFNNDFLRGEGPHPICLKSDTTFQMIAYDRSETIPDTAWIAFDLPENTSPDSCACNFDYTVTTSGGSESRYTGGYEVLIEDYSQLYTLNDKVYEAKAAFPNRASILYEISNITDRYPDIFSWLEMLDINVVIIIILMIVVSVINMISAMIILIIERTSMIGLLKAFGIDNMRVVVIFMLHSIRIISWGVFLGNVIGLGFALLQEKFRFITLDASNYYMNYVPVKVVWSQVLVIDGVTLLVCAFCLLLPALLVTFVNPVKAIRFD